jgi:alpha-L-fucosidase
LVDLVKSYHDTVGNNCVLELGFAVDKTGAVPDDQLTRLREFGNWVELCYGQALAETSGNATELALKFATPVTMDRVLISEDLADGQLVRGYSVSVRDAKTGQWGAFSSGASIGNKRIDISAVGERSISEVRLNITASMGLPRISRFATFSPCGE